MFYLVKVEVEDVRDLEICPIYKNEVATDEDVHMVRRRRRKRDFQLVGTGLHPGAEFYGHEPLSDDETFLPGRKAIAFCQAGRQMPVVRVIPTADLSIMVMVSLTAFVSIGVSATMLVIAVVVRIAVMISAMVVVPIVFVVPMVVILSNGEGASQCQCKNRERSGAEKELQGH